VVLSGVAQALVPMVHSAMQDLVSGCQQERSTSCGKAGVQLLLLSEAQEYVQQQPVVGADETSWAQAMRTKVIH